MRNQKKLSTRKQATEQYNRHMAKRAMNIQVVNRINMRGFINVTQDIPIKVVALGNCPLQINNFMAEFQKLDPYKILRIKGYLEYEGLLLDYGDQQKESKFQMKVDPYFFSNNPTKSGDKDISANTVLLCYSEYDQSASKKIKLHYIQYCTKHYPNAQIMLLKLMFKRKSYKPGIQQSEQIKKSDDQIKQLGQSKKFKMIEFTVEQENECKKVLESIAYNTVRTFVLPKILWTLTTTAECAPNEPNPLSSKQNII